MTVQHLVDASNILNDDGVTAVDYSIPMNRDGSYPHGGRAVAVYRRGSHIPLIVSYALLAEMAIANLIADNMRRLLDPDADDSDNDAAFYRSMDDIHQMVKTLVGGRNLCSTLLNASECGHTLTA